MLKTKVLFILKKRQAGPYGSWSYSYDGSPLPSGLSVSAGQIQYALDDLGVANKLVQVIDNNCIDREVSLYQPTHVIIEAFWVVPEKFDVLRKLHPNVVWIIRNHSKTAFLSHEGGMIGWAIDYLKRGLTLACNSEEATQAFRNLARIANADSSNVVFLPNYYKTEYRSTSFLGALTWRKLRSVRWYSHPMHLKDNTINIGCFGAIRPLKNHLNQAIAALEFASDIHAKLKFYINASRIEGKAESILTSLRQLFARYPEHELVEVPWMEHSGFTSVIEGMDIVTQVSNSETFNIVAADAVANGVPVLVSNEIPWLTSEYEADPNDVPKIVDRMKNLYHGGGNGWLQIDQYSQLRAYCEHSKHVWKEYLYSTMEYYR